MVAPNTPLRDFPLFYTQEQMFVPHIEEKNKSCVLEHVLESYSLGQVHGSSAIDMANCSLGPR